MATTTYTRPLSTTTSGTDRDDYFPSGGGFINTKGATSVALITQRTAETGICTLQAFVEFHYAPLSSAASTTMVGSFLPLLDLATGVAVSSVVYADAQLDTATPFHRFLVLQATTRLTTAADNAVALATNNKYYTLWIPEKIRFRFRSGGTTVTNTFSAECHVHTARG